MIFLNVVYVANMNKEKVQKIANVIIVYGYYQRERKKMDKKLAFLILFPNYQIAKRKYKKSRKMLNKILFRLIQQQEIFYVCLTSRDEIFAITVRCPERCPREKSSPEKSLQENYPR